MSNGPNPLGRSLRPRTTGPVRAVADTFPSVGTKGNAATRRVKTSLALDVEVYRRAKIAAIQQECTVSEYIERAIQSALEE